jgi:branched-chain amino acid transport system permease protein
VVAILAAMLAASLAACAPSELGRTRVCEQALRALMPEAEPHGHQAANAETIVLFYREASGEQSLVCRFAQRGLESDGMDLVEVMVPQGGPISPITLFLLKTYGLGRGGESGPDRLPGWAYLAQQVANALAPAAIYALLAAGYALIYGITGRINLAFGEFTTVGAFAALVGILIGAATPLGIPGLALGGLLLAGSTGAALGAVLYGVIFRPLLRRGSQALLIATIGLAIVLSEGLRLATGSGQRWLQPLFTAPLRLGPLIVSPSQLGLAALAIALIGILVAVLRRTAFGRAYRACADDAGAAALMGVNVDRTTRHACMLGSVLAAVAGFVLVAHYGVVSFTMGTLLGLKALTAAVVGGIGSVPGAALGGVLIGLFESLWAGYLPGAYREVALFVILALTLALRPAGLLGQPLASGNPMLWRRPPV